MNEIELKELYERMDALLTALQSSMGERIDGLRRKEYLTAAEVEDLYGLTKGSLSTMRCRGSGPTWYKCGKTIIYKQQDILSYIEHNRYFGSPSWNA